MEDKARCAVLGSRKQRTVHGLDDRCPAPVDGCGIRRVGAAERQVSPALRILMRQPLAALLHTDS